jgi:hypothetical protein
MTSRDMMVDDRWAAMVHLWEKQTILPFDIGVIPLKVRARPPCRTFTMICYVLRPG